MQVIVNRLRGNAESKWRNQQEEKNIDKFIAARTAER